MSEVLDNWSEPVEALINEGRRLIKSQDLNGIAALRFELAAWRGYVGNQWARLHQITAKAKSELITGGLSAAAAEAASDATESAREMRRAKEMLDTINQLLNACATVINVLLSEKTQGNIDKIDNS